MDIAILLVSLFGWNQVVSPVFEVDLWPGEGRPVFETVGKELRLLETPLQSANVMRNLAFPEGTRLRFDETRYQTLEPGRIEVLRDTVISGRTIGDRSLLTRDEYYSGAFPQESHEVRRGEAIEYLQYRAEGTCFVRIGSVVIDAEMCPVFIEAAFSQLSEPKVAWWIRIVDDSRAMGWLLVEDSVVKQTDRIF